MVYQCHIKITKTLGSLILILWFMKQEWRFLPGLHHFFSSFPGGNLGEQCTGWKKFISLWSTDWRGQVSPTKIRPCLGSQCHALVLSTWVFYSVHLKRMDIWKVSILCWVFPWKKALTRALHEADRPFFHKHFPRTSMVLNSLAQTCVSPQIHICIPTSSTQEAKPLAAPCLTSLSESFLEGARQKARLEARSIVLYQSWPLSSDVSVMMLGWSEHVFDFTAPRLTVNPKEIHQRISLWNKLWDGEEQARCFIRGELLGITFIKGKNEE